LQKQNYHHEDLKTELIQKGLLIFGKEGYEGLSLRKVAKACGVSQTAPYRHFKDKDGLIAAITMHAIRLFDLSLQQAGRKPGNPGEQLREMGIAYVHFFVANPKYLKLLFFSNIKDYLAKDICGVHGRLEEGHPFSTLINAVKRYKEWAPNETRSVEELTLYCWGLVHGISILISSGHMPCGGDHFSLAESVIRSEKFLK
jgi:AcrR family transcriptional regulator